MRRLVFILLASLATLLVACDTIAAPTGDTSTDVDSAQNQLPSFANYAQTDAQNVKEALTRAIQAGSLATGNLISAGILERLNTMADCFADVGALAGRVYTSLNPPAAGLLVVVNNERITSNFMQCAVNPGARAQMRSAVVEPCASAGTYTDNNITYSYIYASSDPSMCGSFEEWLGTKQR